MWYKKEKGSVTLFVLMAMIFFMVISVSAYVMASNKLQGQNAEIERIKAAYEQDLSDEALNQLYKKSTANYQVQSTGDTFLTLAEAVENSAKTDTIVQLCDVEDSSSVIIDGKNITFDNNGKTLTKKASGIKVNSGATLEVAGDGTITTNEVNLISNSGTLNITHTGTISDTGVGTDKRLIANTGTLNKTGTGTITSSNSYSAIGTWYSDSVVTISAGLVSSKGSIAIHCYIGATLNIQGTARILSEVASAIQLGGHSSGSNATLNITGGEIESLKGSAISMSTYTAADTINIVMTDGEIKGVTYGIYNNDVAVANTTITIGDQNKSVSTTTPVISGGTCGIYSNGTGTVNFYNGIIKGTNAVPYNIAGTLNLRSGYNITVDDASTTSDGLYWAYLK